MKDKIFSILQRVGRSFMLPIAILPAAGILLGIGESFTNAAMLDAYNLTKIMGPGTALYAILSVCSACGNVVFENLPLIFAIGVSIGMAKAEKEVAALSSAIAFLIMHTATSTMIMINDAAEKMKVGFMDSVLGIDSLQMGVFGGVIVGLGVAYLHNRFYKIKLPDSLSFFGGTRFVPIVSSVAYVMVGVLMFFIWPPIQDAMYAIGGGVKASGYLGTFLYGIMERALLPFGLHHVFYLPFWQTSLGGIMEIGGNIVEGAQNIFFAQLADKSTTHFTVEATRFMTGKFPLMIFGLPGAALAMYKCAKPEKRRKVGGLLISAALTSMLTGITEPLEFTFLFVAPGLYIVHCILAGAAYMLMHMCNVCVGMTFSGGVIDMILFGVMQGQEKTNWLMIIPVGVIYFAVYYFLFTFLIMKFNFKTPGRDDEEVKLYTRADVNMAKMQGSRNRMEGDETSVLIAAGLGGASNISDLDCCVTRLRCTVYNPDLVDESILKRSGSRGIIRRGNGVQIIYGPTVPVIKSNFEEYLSGEADYEEKAENSLFAIDVVKAPLPGKRIALEQVADEVFSEKMLGEGFAVEPTKGEIYAPVTGTVSAIFDTKHAIGFISEHGAEILVHVGIDTVQLRGKYYDIKVETGQKVTAGELVGTFDANAIRKAGFSVTTPVIVSNTEDYKKIEIHLESEDVLILTK
ncbi:MAG: glucose PTS transporter subunit IIA [Lachnospiraceae bacterium]|nr:glucose PTS transporter subunit IIA [Lachnospiraceae bacterium]